ncbi:hypothetical protein C8C78_12715 [Halanaerobium congolense]|jgi:hypothetical protein|uniref:Uncharacterized protein n=1 Tax=Halanaerobium congolense TaxID=54121 RepID=A0A318DZ80_9FIRM|nr:hypothetical protein [Halanaerobium congolense]PXV62939.1 hypothetical protein C8C78_12715 [Halanaerobium congolense]
MRIILNSFSVVIIILIFILIIKTTALAHIPLDTSDSATKAEPIFVEDHQISWAAYNQLDNADNVDYSSFKAEQDQGKYTLAIGHREVWTFSDLIKMPKIWWDTRIFVEKENSTYIISALFIAVSSFILYKFIF